MFLAFYSDVSNNQNVEFGTEYSFFDIKEKRNTIVNSSTSEKNYTTGYSQVCWEMIWRFALCLVPTSVLLQGDCMILRDIQSRMTTVITHHIVKVTYDYGYYLTYS
jgi:hypothetical protein